MFGIQQWIWHNLTSWLGCLILPEIEIVESCNLDAKEWKIRIYEYISTYIMVYIGFVHIKTKCKVVKLNFWWMCIAISTWSDYESELFLMCAQYLSLYSYLLSIVIAIYDHQDKENRCTMLGLMGHMFCVIFLSVTCHH